MIVALLMVVCIVYGYALCYFTVARDAEEESKFWYQSSKRAWDRLMR